MSNAGSDPGYEKRDVNVKMIFLIALLVLVVVVVFIVILNEYFLISSEDMIYETVLKPVSAELRDLHARETKALTTYGIIADTTGTLYRIPIKQAMQLYLDELRQQADK